MCLVHFSSDDQDGPTRVVDREFGSPLMDDVGTPMDNPLSDMTLSVIRSRSTYVTNYLTALSSSFIRARD
jgi:hypothetical protein